MIVPIASANKVRSDRLGGGGAAGVAGTCSSEGATQLRGSNEALLGGSPVIVGADIPKTMRERPQFVRARNERRFDRGGSCALRHSKGMGGIGMTAGCEGASRGSIVLPRPIARSGYAAIDTRRDPLLCVIQSTGAAA